MDKQNQGITIENDYLVAVLQNEVNKLMQENVHLKAYIEQLANEKNESTQSE
ncbi:MAG: hypothetical protein Q4F01_05790 [Staphylococcus rostri]|uniref:hypothetical protein n=1 Tax=Staphylococcus rostri TaxID=522262 RepID=UPI0026E09D5E|nr:hypothetical protein [Staphylococcus rostri]MDO5375685.1 hypothetical protein [Staphylococcus rostri]